MTGLQRCETSWGARRGQCAVWLSSDTLCDRKLGHYPAEPHRGHDPSGSGRWIEYVERDGQPVEVARGGSRQQAVPEHSRDRALTVDEAQ